MSSKSKLVDVIASRIREKLNADLRRKEQEANEIRFRIFGQLVKAMKDIDEKFDELPLVKHQQFDKVYVFQLHSIRLDSLEDESIKTEKLADILSKQVIPGSFTELTLIEKFKQEFDTELLMDVGKDYINFSINITI